MEQCTHCERCCAVICVVEGHIMMINWKAFATAGQLLRRQWVQKERLTTTELAIILIERLRLESLARGVQGTELNRSKLQAMESSPVLEDLRYKINRRRKLKNVQKRPETQ